MKNAVELPFLRNNKVETIIPSELDANSANHNLKGDAGLSSPESNANISPDKRKASKCPVFGCLQGGKVESMPTPQLEADPAIPDVKDVVDLSSPQSKTNVDPDKHKKKASKSRLFHNPWRKKVETVVPTQQLDADPAIPVVKDGADLASRKLKTHIRFDRPELKAGIAAASAELQTCAVPANIGPRSTTSPGPKNARRLGPKDARNPEPKGARWPWQKDGRCPGPKDGKSLGRKDRRTLRPKNAEKPRPKDAGKPGPKDDVKPKPKDAGKSRPKDARNPQSKGARWPWQKDSRTLRPKNAEKPRPKDAGKPGPKDDVKPKPKDDVKAKPKDDVKAKPKDDVKPKPKDDVKAKPKDDGKSGPKDAGKPGPKDAVKPKPKDAGKSWPKDARWPWQKDPRTLRPKNAEKPRPKDARKPGPKDAVKPKPKDAGKSRPKDARWPWQKDPRTLRPKNAEKPRPKDARKPGPKDAEKSRPTDGKSGLKADVDLSTSKIKDHTSPANAKLVPAPETPSTRGSFLSKYYYSECNVLGQGSFGKVYKGTRRSDGKEVAIKLMQRTKHDKYLVTPGYTKPLLTEVALMLKMRESPISPFVIQMHDWYEDPRMFGLVLEYSPPCETLWRFMTSRFRQTESVARIIMQQAVQAVQDCLNHGVFHTDIHPENFLLDKGNMKLKLIDFGLGHLLTNDGYNSKDFRGALLFTPPEVHTEPKYYAMPTNVWALGVLLYTLVNGFYPFPEKAKKSHKLQLTKNFFSKEICDLIKRCLAKKPTKRPTIQQILDHDWFKIK